MTVSEYLERKDKLLNTTSIRKNGATIILHEGKEYPLKQWEQMHFLPDRLVQCKDNPDRRKQFLIP